MSALIQPSPAATAIHSLPTRERRKQPLRACVQSALEMYFMDMDGHQADGVYDMVVGQVEQAMLECVCLLYTSPSPRDRTRSRMPSSA